MSLTMVSLACVLLVTLFSARTTIDARAIQQDTLGLVVNDLQSGDEELLGTLANYRHRFAHSPNIKALRWALKTKDDPINYCELCHLVVPVVSSLYSSVLVIALFYYSFEWSSKLIKRNNLKLM